MLAGSYAPGFKLALHHKDLGICQVNAKECLWYKPAHDWDDTDPVSTTDGCKAMVTMISPLYFALRKKQLAGQPDWSTVLIQGKCGQTQELIHRNVVSPESVNERWSGWNQRQIDDEHFLCTIVSAWHSSTIVINWFRFPLLQTHLGVKLDWEYSTRHSSRWKSLDKKIRCNTCRERIFHSPLR